MVCDFLSVTVGQSANSLGVLRIDCRDLCAPDHGGRRKASHMEVGDHDVLGPPPVIRALDHEDPEKSMGILYCSTDYDECGPMLPHRTIRVRKWHLDHVPRLKVCHR